MTVSNRIAALALNCGFGNSLVMRKNFLSVDVQGLLFIAAHQVDVELRDANLPQCLELFAVLFDGADKAKAIDDLVGHKISVIAADLTVVQVVILAPVFYERNQ